jgi:hypothetical protein
MLEGLKKETSPYHSCRVRMFVDTLEPADQKLMQGYLDDPEFGPIALSSALSRRGLTLSEKSIRKHKQNLCSCFRD